ncbi:MAG TPA: hypothetical protein VG675_22715 [Bryobacteraceae bacterium]|nr:hypothetical protein [Bryobacteraceae bacterium]
MIDSFLESIRCAHRRTTFPITLAAAGKESTGGSAAKKTYIVCLNCGKEIPYNWAGLGTEEPAGDSLSVRLGQISADEVRRRVTSILARTRRLFHARELQA